MPKLFNLGPFCEMKCFSAEHTQGLVTECLFPIVPYISIFLPNMSVNSQSFNLPSISRYNWSATPPHPSHITSNQGAASGPSSRPKLAQHTCTGMHLHCYVEKYTLCTETHTLACHAGHAEHSACKHDLQALHMQNIDDSVHAHHLLHNLKGAQ